MAAEPQTFMSVDEYLALDRAAEYKHEYVDGHAYAMAGGTTTHGQLSVRAATLLDSSLRGTPCRVYSSDVRVQVGDTRFFYPDVSVGCDPRDAGPREMLRFPRVVVEVLSDSTEAYDRGDKFARYRACSTLEEYVVVSQREASVEIYRRAGNEWIYHAFGPNDDAELKSVGVRFAVADLYADVELPASPSFPERPHSL